MFEKSSSFGDTAPQIWYGTAYQDTGTLKLPDMSTLQRNSYYPYLGNTGPRVLSTGSKFEKLDGFI